jgi:hypothetical protein
LEHQAHLRKKNLLQAKADLQKAVELNTDIGQIGTILP